MQIEIYNPGQGQPLPPIQWNYEELKAQLTQALESYKGRVYTEDSIQLAKKDRATLNKLADAIDGKRKEMKAMYLAPYEQFEAQAKELTQMVKDHAVEIDAQVKAYDDARKLEKQESINVLYNAMIGKLSELVPYDRLHNPKWLNVSVSMSTVSDELGRAIDKIIAGLNSIDSLKLEPSSEEQVKNVFLKNFDLAAALTEKERIERKREEMARFKAAQQEDRQVISASDPDAFKKAKPGDIISFGGAESAPEPEEMVSVVFKINVTKTQLKELGDYMKAHGIRPERV